MSGRTYVRRGAQAVPNRVIHSELSYAALGLLVVLLARPETAPQGYRDLAGRGLGEKATRGALRELDEAGYRHQVTLGRGRGKLVTYTVVSDEPLPSEEAEEWLIARIHRAATGAARSDAPKSQVRTGIRADRIVRHLSRHDGSQRDGARHSLLRDSNSSSLRSEEGPNARAWRECPTCEGRREFCDRLGNAYDCPHCEGAGRVMAR